MPHLHMQTLALNKLSKQKASLLKKVITWAAYSEHQPQHTYNRWTFMLYDPKGLLPFVATRLVLGHKRGDIGTHRATKRQLLWS